MSLKVKNPISFLVSGASGAGKTYWIFQLINNLEKVIVSEITKVYYFYTIWQDKFDEYINKVEFIQRMPDLEALKNARRSLVILDDLCMKILRSYQKFTIYSHHYNFTVIDTVQNVFHKSHRQISLNAQFVVLFKNCRDVNQIVCFLCQAFPQKHKAVLEAYKNATLNGRGYILFDFRCDTRDKERIRSNIFPDEINYVYQ